MDDQKRKTIKTQFNDHTLRLLARDHVQGNLAWHFAADLHELFSAMDHYNRTKPVAESAISILAHDRLNDWLIENRKKGMKSATYHNTALYLGKENIDTNAYAGPLKISGGVIVQYREESFSSVYVVGKKRSAMRITSASGETGDFFFGREKNPDPVTFGPIPLFTRAPL